MFFFFAAPPLTTPPHDPKTIQAAVAPAGPPEKLSAITWNMAAINNNPFEYWITHDDRAYNQLMEDVSTFINDPGQQVPSRERTFFSATKGRNSTIPAPPSLSSATLVQFLSFLGNCRGR